jgi:predicted TPR repeat methyltransferase
MYRQRVELALGECTGGDRVLEVGFGTGLAFPNLHDMYREIHGIDLTADIMRSNPSLSQWASPVS